MRTKLVSYLREKIFEYDDRVGETLSAMDVRRSSLQNESPMLYNEIWERTTEFLEENGIQITDDIAEEYSPENVIFWR